MTQKRYIRLRRTELLAGNCDLPPLYRVIQYFRSIFPDNPRDGVIAGTPERTGGHLDIIDLYSLQRPQSMNMEHVNEGYGLMKIGPSLTMALLNVNDLPYYNAAFIRAKSYVKVVLKEAHEVLFSLSPYQTCTKFSTAYLFKKNVSRVILSF